VVIVSASAMALGPTTKERKGGRFSIFAPGSAWPGVAGVRGQDERSGSAGAWRLCEFQDWSGPHRRRGTDNCSPVSPSRPAAGRRAAAIGCLWGPGDPRKRPKQATSMARALPAGSNILPILCVGATWRGPPVQAVVDQKTRTSNPTAPRMQKPALGHAIHAAPVESTPRPPRSSAGISPDRARRLDSAWERT
jgi:hypothetical protein